jgi:hypothetical protein
MNGRTIARVVLALVIVLGGLGVAVGPYNAGLSAGLVQSGQVVVAPGAMPIAAVPYAYRNGWGFHGFGFLGGLVFLFLLIGLVRAAVGGARRGWRPG